MLARVYGLRLVSFDKESVQGRGQTTKQASGNVEEHHNREQNVSNLAISWWAEENWGIQLSKMRERRYYTGDERRTYPGGILHAALRRPTCNSLELVMRSVAASEPAKGTSPWHIRGNTSTSFSAKILVTPRSRTYASGKASDREEQPHYIMHGGW